VTITRGRIRCTIAAKRRKCSGHELDVEPGVAQRPLHRAEEAAAQVHATTREQRKEFDEQRPEDL
jgi:uncharacterized protein YicC (UPF0701 family)